MSKRFTVQMADTSENVNWKPRKETEVHPTNRYDPEYPDVPEHMRISYWAGSPWNPPVKEEKD